MKSALFAISPVVALALLVLPPASRAQTAPQNPADDFHTSERCANCHNKLKTSKGEDVSINVDWSASSMANSARDPYWQGSVRRETIDHPESSAAIQSECASCHMPLQYQQDKAQNRDTAVFSRLPLGASHPAPAPPPSG